jgi:hypothetical protein
MEWKVTCAILGVGGRCGRYGWYTRSGSTIMYISKIKEKGKGGRGGGGEKRGEEREGGGEEEMLRGKGEEER